MGSMMMHVMVAHEHDVSAYFDPSAAVKRRASPRLIDHPFRPTTSSNAGAINREVTLLEAFIQ
jgi:hypothetical protein